MLNTFEIYYPSPMGAIRRWLSLILMLLGSPRLFNATKHGKPDTSAEVFMDPWIYHAASPQCIIRATLKRRHHCLAHSPP
ncbi:hypothetical protein M011DRAFT_247877 [Sporormia fimetaria CBS 119925]|uniref:Secreted protein n=1 Tax=Sporormia fimetaria CBS 119925 TaxID=1340428 RepID=A0A6A6V1Q9_9PLEO|nr:hypothetical protein M011DRAFT_247877 [Sporormia fimetaria CBS 119925]